MKVLLIIIFYASVNSKDVSIIQESYPSTATCEEVRTQLVEDIKEEFNILKLAKCYPSK